jgi:hypothetical protein
MRVVAAPGGWSEAVHGAGHLLFQDAYVQLLLVLLISCLRRPEATVSIYLLRGWHLFKIRCVCGTDVSRKVNVNCCLRDVFLSLLDRLECSSETWLVAVVYLTSKKSVYVLSFLPRTLFRAKKRYFGYCKMTVTCVVRRTQIGSKYCDM